MWWRDANLIQTRRITGTNNELFSECWNIYEEAFPADQRRSKEKHSEIMKRDEYCFQALISDGKCIGIFAFWKINDYQFIEHFAIKQELRNKGNGTSFIKDFIKNNKKILIDVERPEMSHIAKRRIAFLKRFGFNLNKFNYMQPSYGNGKSPVKMHLMTYPSEIAEKDYYKLRNLLHLKVYSCPSPVSDI